MKYTLCIILPIILLLGCTNGETTSSPKTISNIISPSTHAQFTFDQSIANYKFEWEREKSFRFIDTQKPTEIVEAHNSILFSEMEPMDLSKKTDLFWFWIDSMSQGKRRVFDNNDLQQVKIGDYDALVFDSRFQKKVMRGAIYMALIWKGDQAIKIVGTAHSNVEAAQEQFRKTAASIKFK